MTRTRTWIAGLAALLVLLGWLHGADTGAQAQAIPTATPVQIDLFQAVPAAQQANATATLTRTPTPVGPVQIEAKGTSNVRSLPDPGSELLGQVRPGEYYNAIRRYYHWIEFQFDAAPNKRGWIFDELITIHGDPNSLPSVTSLDDPGAGAVDLDATVTELSVTMTPGGLLTATALARTSPALAQPGASTGNAPQAVQIEGIDAVNSTQEVTPRVVLPTYTYPPGVAAFAPTAAPSENPDAAPTATLSAVSTLTSLLPAGNLPPIVPILGLAALGLLGLVVSALRR